MLQMEQKVPGQAPEERTLGGDPGTGQDVTIILVPNGVPLSSYKDQKLALIHLHSNVLSSHCKYFNTCLSDRWKKSTLPSASIEFVLEVQTDVQYYFDCFSNMYSPFAKNFQGARQSVELLKVASQIDFQQLMERISLYLSTIFWSDEDEIRVREYSSSPDFPRMHLKDLVARLGLDKSEEDCQKQLCEMIRQCIRIALNATDQIPSCSPRAFFTELLQGIGRGAPPDYARTVIAIVSREAKDMFVKIGDDWDVKIWSHQLPTGIHNWSHQLNAMCWILETLLMLQVAEELVQGFVHLEAIAKCISDVDTDWYMPAKQKFAELVLLMYQEVAAGNLLLRLPERIALLTNWHSVMKSKLEKERYEQATRNLFSTLPLKQQVQFINLQKENFNDYISSSSLISMLSKRSWSDFTPFETETVDSVILGSRS